MQNDYSNTATEKIDKLINYGYINAKTLIKILINVFFAPFETADPQTAPHPCIRELVAEPCSDVCDETGAGRLRLLLLKARLTFISAKKKGSRPEVSGPSLPFASLHRRGILAA